MRTGSRSSELLRYRRFRVLRDPAFQLVDRHEPLAPAPDQPEMRGDVGVEEIRADTYFACLARVSSMENETAVAAGPGYAGSCSRRETKDACGLGSSCPLPTSLSSSPI